MQKSKTILPFRIFIFFLVLFSFFTSFIRCNYIFKTSIYNGNEELITGTIIDYKMLDTKYKMTILTNKGNILEKVIASIYLNDNDSNLRKKVSDFKIGDRIILKGNLNKPLNNTTPNTFNYQKYLYYQKIYYLFTVKEIMSIENSSNLFYKLQDFLYKRCEMIDEKGYLTMLIYGKKNIDADTYSYLQDLGVVHLFAISGLHISIFTMLLEALLKKIKMGPRNFIIIIFLIIYASLLGFPASVMRALMMFIFLKVFSFLKEKFKMSFKTYEIMLLSTGFLLIINPYFLYDTGFLYSNLCTFGLIYYNDKTKNYFLKSLKTTYIATLWSLPLTVSLNYSYNLLTPLFNIVFVPFISFLFYPISLITFLFPFFLPVLKILIRLLELLTIVFTKVSINIILPKMSIAVIIIYYINVFLISKYRKVYYHLFNILILIIYPYGYNLDDNLKVYYLDVSQGDASLIISPKNREVTLIDTGGMTTDKNYYTAKNILKFLHSIDIKKIDNLIISHGDFDHIGNAFYLVDNIKIEKVILNCGEVNDLENDLIKILTKNQIKYYTCIKELNINDNKLSFLQTKKYDNENDNSNVIYTELNGYKFMFMGDASKLKEEDIIKKYKLAKIDFLKVGHHGSKTSSSKEFINKINPKYSIISVGRKNKYGHPNKEVLNNLDNSKIYRTDQDGSIMFKIKNNKLEIKTYSP